MHLLSGFIFITALALAKPGPAVLRSPDGRLAVAFRTLDAVGGQLVYEISFQGKPLVEPSAMALDFGGYGIPLGADVRIAGAVTSIVDETYKLVAGKSNPVRNHANAMRIELEERSAGGRKYAVEARAYDDAVAFRYLVPEQAGWRDFRLTGERTEFRIVKDPIIYALLLPHFRSMYESEFVKLSASSLSNQGGVASTMLVGLPLVMQVPGVAWMAIDEADLRGTAGMYVTNPSGGWTSHKFESRLAPHVDDTEVAVAGRLPYQSAWRVLTVASEAGRLVESDVLTNLNPAAAIADTSWIRPGKASWDWWSGSLGRDGKGAYTTENMKYYVDFAAQSGFEYMLVDAGWAAHGDITKLNGRVDVPELVRYAAAKKVRIWIWLYYGDTVRQMAEAFPLFEQWGVAGLKIDFIERDDQAGMAWYYRVAELAAKHHLMVDFHGSTKPTGMERMWPNVLGYEAVLGMEQSKAGSRDNPDHHVMLPFTRMLGGLMDYTPGGFNNATKAGFEARSSNPMVMGTRAHQLAMYAIYEAPIQMVADHPGAYKDQPAFEFIRAVPTAWDESRVLNGVPGEYITMARRRGREWFLGSMTNWTSRRLDVSLSFLGAGRYRAEIYADGTDAAELPKNVSITRKTVDREMKLDVEMAPGGGCAVRFVPVKE